MSKQQILRALEENPVAALEAIAAALDELEPAVVGRRTRARIVGASDAIGRLANRFEDGSSV
jgi:hypothetical protein